MWNDLVRVLNSKAQKYSGDREMAKMYLGQLNTARASSMSRFTGEVENFIYRTKHIK